MTSAKHRRGLVGLRDLVQLTELARGPRPAGPPRRRAAARRSTWRTGRRLARRHQRLDRELAHQLAHDVVGAAGQDRIHPGLAAAAPARSPGRATPRAHLLVPRVAVAALGHGVEPAPDELGYLQRALERLPLHEQRAARAGSAVGRAAGSRRGRPGARAARRRAPRRPGPPEGPGHRAVRSALPVAARRSPGPPGLRRGRRSRTARPAPAAALPGPPPRPAGRPRAAAADTAERTSRLRHPDPAGQQPRVLRAQGGVADAGHDRRRPAQSPPTRPSAVVRSNPASVDRIAKANSGVRPATSSRTAASPCARRSSHGSMPSGETAMNVCATNRWSPSKARSAAFCPAASPSKVKITSPPKASSSIR